MANPKTRRPRVYVAGPYACRGRCPEVGVSLVDMRKGLEACMRLLQEGWAPFCPWLDFMFELMNYGGGLPKKWYYEYSNAFLLACDIVYVHNIRKGSTGVVDEMLLAEKHGIPVVNSLTKLEEWKNQWTQQQASSSPP